MEGEREGTSKLIVSVSFGSHASFKWKKGKSCPDGEISSCWLGHGDILVVDGRCQDEFLHCTDPRLEQERTDVTFRWNKQHSVSCPLRTGLVCLLLPTCAQGSSAAVSGGRERGGVGDGAFWAFWVLLEVLCTWRGTRFAGLSPHLCGPRVTEVCLSLDTHVGRRLAGTFSA